MVRYRATARTMSIFVFLCLHQVGAHFTCSEVPYDVWFRGFTGRTFNGLVG